MDEFVALHSIPNLASDRANIQRNAVTIAKMMDKRGVASRLVSVPDANPVVFGEIQTPGATRTIVLDAHYDGQPLDPKEWATPPFTPVLRDQPIEKDGQVIPLPAAGVPFHPEWRLYARGAADDKAPIAAMMTALDAIRAAGNWAPNPAMMLARLLKSMKDDSGRVLVDGFYDGIEPLSETEKRAVAESPDVDPVLRNEFWLGSTESAPMKLAELITLPSLNIRGMASARIGAQASSVVPSTATATIDMRLVKGMDHRRTAERLVDHIRKQGFFVVDKEPSADMRRAHPKVALVVVKPGAYNSVRTSMDLPISQDLIRTVESARGTVVRVPNMGGSVPLEIIERALGTRTIMVPIGNHDNNQHSFNENLGIQNLWYGIELMAALLTM